MSRRFSAVLAGAAVVVATLGLAACGKAGEDSGDSGSGGSNGGASYAVAKNPSFPDGSTMATLNKAGSVRIGVKFDQPGVGFKGTGDKAPAGFDIEMGKIIAAKLGIAPDKINWQETISDNREPFLEQGKVDFVIASYSITDERRKLVGQAGPYFVTGQQLLVAKDSDIAGPDDLKGKKVCSVTGSTSIKTVEQKYGAVPQGFDTYSECVEQVLNGSSDALTTDGSILLGYAAQNPDKLKVVGDPFSEERYGIGFKKGDNQLCSFLNDTLQESFKNGDWSDAFAATLGKSGVKTPTAPSSLDPCQ